MFAQATCPHCELSIRVPIDYADRSVKCPQCEQRFTVGTGSVSAPDVGGPSDAPGKRGANRPTSVVSFEALVMEVLSTDED